MKKDNIEPKQKKPAKSVATKKDTVKQDNSKKEATKKVSHKKNVADTPFMPQPKAKVDTEEAKKKKKKRRFFWIFFMVGVVVVSFAAVGAGLYMKYSEKDVFLISITVDPMVVDSRGETHVSGGKTITFEDVNSAQHSLDNLEVMLSYNQYFVYKCSISNRSNKNVSLSFEVSTTQKDNCSLSYLIGGGAELPYTEKVEDVQIAPGQTLSLCVLIRIDDMDYNSYIKGTFSIYVNEAGA